ncbi:TPA: hypothetical protein H1005_01025 [archaeon]|uniref:Uncharacterized protein n=1 Tax=Candidatus Naiadarchaeum limnaeum TaxID=2756139 RepID=A0A832UQX4_9ARCH|nr:hypothetical protein [Candidatus Naiadarchaeales archaeon SRR2090153.bin1042]HIK00047.1 hypothetical protein [Candidatus Naiadarchaeum limnaeum]
MKRFITTMIRRTITFNVDIYNELMNIRASAISAGKEMSFTTIVNVVLLGGILGANKFDTSIWKEILSFIEEESSVLELEALRDQYVEKMVKKMATP